mgnify:CR=1 FL=1
MVVDRPPVLSLRLGWVVAEERHAELVGLLRELVTATKAGGNVRLNTGALVGAFSDSIGRGYA